MVMAMMALAIGADKISTQARREAIINGLSDLPSMIVADVYILQE